MNKILNWVFAATLVCGASVFTSCSNDDNPILGSGEQNQWGLRN